MKHNIIETENYLLIVSDEEIKAGNFYLLIPENIVKLSRCGLPTNIREWAKIIAHLPLNNSPVIEGVPLLPPLEDEVGVLSEQEFPYIKDSLVQTTKSEQNKHTDTLRWGFKKGYNKAKEKYKYTEEDLRKCWKACLDFNKPAGGDSGINLEDFIQSLQQPKMPVAFECESTQYTVDEMSKLPLGTVNQKPKTTTNPQGQTVLVGKYIY
jgi:hypothetical protein